MRIYIIRHGQPAGAERGRRYLGLTDEPLAPEGRRQAEETGARLAGMTGRHEVRIVSSPLTRCRQTALAIQGHVNCSFIEIVQDLHEIDLGKWDGRYAEEIKREYPEEYLARGRDMWSYRTPEGETFAEAGERFRAAVERLTVSAGEDDVMIIVAHAGVMKAGLSLLTETPFDEWAGKDIPYACGFMLEACNGQVSLAEYIG